MDLKQLEYFKVLCETKNITKAAQQLYLSRQSLSTSMKRLEEELEADLFFRSKEGVELTECGELFAAFVRRVEEQFLQCREEMLAIGKERKEVIRLGLPSGLHTPDDLQMFFAFEQRSAAVVVDILDNCSADAWKQLEAGKLDIAFTVRPPQGLELNSILLYQTEQCILMSNTDALARQESVDFTKDLRGKTILETESRMSQYTGLLRSLGIHIKMVQGDHELLQVMIARRKGYVITLPSLSERYLSDGICMRPLRNMPPEMDLNPYLVYRKGISANAEEFLRYLCSLNGVDPAALLE